MTLNLVFNKIQQEKMAEMQRLSSAESSLGVVSRALAVYEHVLKAKGREAVVVIRERDGSEQEMEVR